MTTLLNINGLTFANYLLNLMHVGSCGPTRSSAVMSRPAYPTYIFGGFSARSHYAIPTRLAEVYDAQMPQTSWPFQRTHWQHIYNLLDCNSYFIGVSMKSSFHLLLRDVSFMCSHSSSSLRVCYLLSRMTHRILLCHIQCQAMFPCLVYAASVFRSHIPASMLT